VGGYDDVRDTSSPRGLKSVSKIDSNGIGLLMGRGSQATDGRYALWEETSAEFEGVDGLATAVTE